ncbi:CAP domain-containing protein [Flagellimonas pacifica]|uniref:Cysteine-rich secretory protein family protein n=1 Tax=Flagellimonas pacifica TaxID=1247520 RepID=A0A285MCE3_9FLAO|nr:CAP domain-containing protein [Allomuricauda parva]SNY94799.1 Cysteine-rich secretory protein family protein [Allomuricauda parva]
MKKLYFAFLAVALIFSLSTCSKTSNNEEEKLAEALLGNEKVIIDPEKMEGELLDLVNDHRASIGLTKLQANSTSYKYAQEHNDYMISKNKLSHDNFQSRASKIVEEINAVKVGENVARYYSTAELTLQGWLNSSSHKKTIEDSYTHTTLSIELDKNGRAYFTQIFIRLEQP